MIGVPFPRFARGHGLPIPPIGGRDVGLDAENRPDAVLQGLLVEGERPEHVAVVGDGDRRHPELGDPLAQLRQTVRAVEKGVLAVEVKMDEVAGHRPIVALNVKRKTENEAAGKRAAFYVSCLTLYDSPGELPPGAGTLRRDDGRRRRDHRERDLHQPVHRGAETLLGRARARGLGRRRRDRPFGSVRVRGARRALPEGGRGVCLSARGLPSGGRVPLRLGLSPHDPGGRARGGRDRVLPIHAAFRRRQPGGWPVRSRSRRSCWSRRSTTLASSRGAGS